MRRYGRSRGIRFADETMSYADFKKTKVGKDMVDVLKKIQANAEIVHDTARTCHQTAYNNDRLIERYLRLLDDAVKMGLAKSDADWLERMIRNAKVRGRQIVAELADNPQFYDQILNGIK